MIRCLRAWSCASALLLPLAAAAAPVRAEHIEAELIAERVAAQRGADNWVALRLAPEHGWHTYWRNPGDSGLPTRLKWTLPAGVAAGDIHWPRPAPERLGDLTNYGYGEETLHLVPVSVPADWPANAPLALAVQAKWLVCADICIPGEANLALTLPVADAVAAVDPEWGDDFARARAQLPASMPAGWSAIYQVAGGDMSLQIQALGAPAGTPEFYPYAGDLVAHSAPQRTRRDGDRLLVSQAVSPYFVEAPPAIDGVLVLGDAAYEIRAQPGTVTALPAAAAPAAAATSAPTPTDAPTLWLALLLAVAGGLILNLMPCVFPVLAIKALAVMESAAIGARERRRHALAYTAGVIGSCVAVAALLLGLRAGGEALGWGFQLQSPPFVGLLAYLMFALGLSLSGVVLIGVRWMGAGQSLTQVPGYAGSFATGVLALVVASPCTAPFMGTALGFAMTQPPALALAVFAALGLGLSLPFLALGFFPALARLLPRPGAWMETFKQVMAFPLYLTAVWLVWVLGRQTDANGAAVVLCGMVAIAFALWLWGRAQMQAARRLVPAALAVAAIGGALYLLFTPFLQPPPAGAAPVPAAATRDWEPYSDGRLAELRGIGRTVFVNLTADWCLTCLANERVTLSNDRVRAAFADHGVAYLKGDWTNEDPAITAVLERFARSGVPLYLLYKNGGEPEVLPQVLTPDLVIGKLQPKIATRSDP